MGFGNWQILILCLGEGFWDFFGRTEWDVCSAVSLRRRWSRGWDPGGNLQVSAGKEPPVGGNDFLSGSPGSGAPDLLGAHCSWTSVSGVRCSALLSRLREVQSGDDSVLEVWFQTPVKFWVHPLCVVVGAGNLTENKRFFPYSMGACHCVCMLHRLWAWLRTAPLSCIPITKCEPSPALVGFSVCLCLGALIRFEMPPWGAFVSF